MATITRVIEFYVEEKCYRAIIRGTRGDPGQTSGPPERCYEAEPPEVWDVDDVEVWDDISQSWFTAPDDWKNEQAVVFEEATTQAWREHCALPIGDWEGDPPEGDPFPEEEEGRKSLLGSRRES